MYMTKDLRVEVGDRLFSVIMCDTFFFNYYNIPVPTFVWGDNLQLIKNYNILRNVIYYIKVMFMFMVFDATFHNISVISWRSVLLMEETGVPGENHRPVASHRQTLSSTHHMSRIRTRNVNGDRRWLQR